MKRFVLFAALAGIAPLLASGSASANEINTRQVPRVTCLANCAGAAHRPVQVGNLKATQGNSAAALLLPAVQAAREAARRYQPPPKKKPDTSNDDCMSCAD